AFATSASNILRKIDEGAFDIPSESLGIRAGYGRPPPRRDGVAEDLIVDLIRPRNVDDTVRPTVPSNVDKGCCG
ncbi:hypothetical protein M569_16187, partial [Genlisea aurea]